MLNTAEVAEVSKFFLWALCVSVVKISISGAQDVVDRHEFLPK